MKIRVLSMLLALSGLLIAGCTAGRQDLAQLSTVPPTPATNRAGPGLWPTDRPAPPFPTATPVSSSAVSTARDQTPEVRETLPATIPSTSGVATSQTPGWTTYKSINDIHDLVFAADGSLWAATSGGLVRWDLGKQTYTRYPITARAIAIAPGGTLWLVKEQGICRFDGASCETYTEADGLLSNYVRAVTVDPNGIVWVGSERGVSRFDGQSWKSYPAPVATNDLAQTSGGEVWAATAGGIGRYLPATDTWMTYTEADGLPSAQAQVIAAGPNDEIWAHLLWEGVFRFDGASWQKVEGVSLSVFDIAFAADGTPWIATTGGMHYAGGGLYYRAGNQWTDVADGQVLHSFTAVALGPGGTVATSTQLGLGLYEGGRWHLLRDGPASDRVTSVAVTPDGAAWFGFGDQSVHTPGWGVSRFDGQAWDYFLDDAEVNVLAVAPDGVLWAGVECGVQRFGGVDWETVARCEDLPSGPVLDIDFAPDGTVWVVNGFGLARFDGESWTVYERLVHSIEVTPDGTGWMSGWEGSQGSFYVARFDGTTWTTFAVADSLPCGFSVRAVTPDGLLWGTTPEGRLASSDGESWTDTEDKQCNFYELPTGLSLDEGVQLGVAPDGALWVATDGAVARFDRESAPDKAWTIYTQDNGLPPAYYRAMSFGSDGTIWLGATRFRPGQAKGGAD